MEHYLAFKRKEILAPTTTWMNLEDMMQSEISQLQKVKLCRIPLIWGTRSTSERQEVEWWVPGAEGGDGNV